jgi:hypothetical protein
MAGFQSTPLLFNPAVDFVKTRSSIRGIVVLRFLNASPICDVGVATAMFIFGADPHSRRSIGKKYNANRLTGHEP